MLLAGEEFADIHDTNHYDWQLKMSAPVDWSRNSHDGHRLTAADASRPPHPIRGPPTVSLVGRICQLGRDGCGSPSML
jgi:hypothetical protein